MTAPKTWKMKQYTWLELRDLCTSLNNGVLFWATLAMVLPFAPKDDEGASKYVFDRLTEYLKTLVELNKEKAETTQYANFKECLDVMYYKDIGDLLLHVNSDNEIVKIIVKWRFITGK